MKPLISVFFPTRARTKMLEASLESLLRLAKNPEQIEICLAYDDDDTESHEYLSGKRWADLLDKYKCTAQVYRLPRWGYKDLHLYVNYLAERSNGKWLFFWSDDATMETNHWDTNVQDNQDWVGLLHIGCRNCPRDNSILPLFHSEWLKMFGCVTPINPLDSWISSICRGAGARKVIPVTIYHERFLDIDPDQTCTDKYNTQGWSDKYHLPEYVQMRLDWVERLRQHLAAQ